MKIAKPFIMHFPGISALLFLLSLFAFLTGISAQEHPSKAIIDSAAIAHWPEISSSVVLSNDGDYVAYVLNSVPYGSQTLFVQSLNNEWKAEIVGGEPTPYLFTAGSKYAVVKTSADTVVILHLGTSRRRVIANVATVLANAGAKEPFIIYKQKDAATSLHLRNLHNDQELIFTNTTYFNFAAKGGALIYQQINERAHAEDLFWFDLSANKTTKVLSAKSIRGLVLSPTGESVAFTSRDSTHHLRLHLYKKGSARAVELAASGDYLHDVMELDGIRDFSDDETKLFIYLNQPNNIHRDTSSAVRLKIWSYADERLDADGHGDDPAKRLLGVIHLPQRDSKIFMIENAHERVVRTAGNYAIIDQHVGRAGHDQLHWNKASQHQFLIRSLTTGISHPITGNPSNMMLRLSPGGDFVIFYDVVTKSFLSIASLTGKIRNLTASIPDVTWSRQNGDNNILSRGLTYELAGWVKGHSVLLNDGSDIWQVSLTNGYAPICLTNFYGKQHSIFFEAVEALHGELRTGSPVIFNAFSKRNKQSGFFELIIGAGKSPRKLHMGPYMYFGSEGVNATVEGLFKPIPAHDAKRYVVARSSNAQSVNLFVTTDFISFLPLTHNYPEKKYNWLNAELHSWRSLNGDSLQGILYKPDDFDVNKIYPVIIHYYEKKSDGLYAYLTPQFLSNGMDINIPLFVSHGYLVFTPDINYTTGDPMQGTYDAIISAADYLKKLFWIDSSKIGIQGGSFGGYQTNYLITHSTYFAAAISSCGVSDLISMYGSRNSSGEDYKSFIEYGQIGMGTSLWESPQAYLKNSPVFRAPFITTPTLFMHSPDDGAVPFQQAFEMFTAMRRLGKPAWLLEYTDGQHGLSGPSAIDFSKKMLDFFDFYLKNGPAPPWMSIYPAGQIPPNNLLTPAVQKIIDSLPIHQCF